MGRHGALFKKSVAFLFLFIGLIWLTVISQRCESISPAKERIEAAQPGTAAYAKLEAERLSYVRSPYAKDHFFILFWMLTAFEVACALAYLLAGFSLLRNLYFGRQLALAALILDAVFKTAAIAYMQFCAIPLAAVTKNPNILSAYFYEKGGWLARFSELCSGLVIYRREAWPEITVYVVLLGGVFYSLNHPAVKKSFIVRQ